MFLSNLFAAAATRTGRHSPPKKLRRTHSFRPSVETLEAREVPAATINGDVFVSISNGQVAEFTPDGVLVQTLTTGVGGFTTGSVFDSAGNFYVTDFGANRITKFDNLGAVVGDFGSGYSLPESILHDKAGNFYVGNAGNNQIKKFDSAGNPLATYVVAVGPRGTDWIELAADQRTLFYTSEGNRIFRFDTVTNTQLADFNAAPLPGSNAFALRLLSSGGLLVADDDAVRRLDNAGNVIQTYTPPGGAGQLFALNLDPDGTTFWTADNSNGNVFRFNIQSGALLKTFNSGSPSGTFGLTVKGEVTVGGGGGTVDVSGIKASVFFFNQVKPKTPRTAIAWINLLNTGPDITGDFTITFSAKTVKVLSFSSTGKVKASGIQDGKYFITFSGGLKKGKSLGIYVQFTYGAKLSLDHLRHNLTFGSGSGSSETI